MIPVTAYLTLIDRAVALSDQEKLAMWRQIVEIRLLPSTTRCPEIERRWV